MTDLSRAIAVKPIITYPREAQVGKTYLMTIDLQPEENFEWQYDEEEYPIYCTVDSKLFSSKPVGEPVIVLHRFGGTYGSVNFLLNLKALISEETLNKEQGSCRITICLINSWGVPFHLSDIEISIGLNSIMYQEVQNIKNKYSIEALRKLDNHNLPSPSHSQFVGRQEELNNLLYRLSQNYYERIITVSGIGGVGKTALVLEAAYACLAAKNEIDNKFIPVFDAIVFSSGQLTTLTAQGITTFSTNNRKPIRTLEDLCVDIAITLKESTLLAVNPDSQASVLKSFLNQQDKRILIILDNLESLENNRIYKIIDFLRSVEGNQIKTVVTTRSNFSIYADVSLRELSQVESLQMIDNLAAEKKIQMSDDFRNKLSQMCGGIPLAISYSIGRLAINQSSERVLSELDEPGGDLSKYCFERLVNDLYDKNSLAFRLLITLSVTPYGATRDALFYFAGITNSERDEAEAALDTLSQSTLIFSHGSHYEMLPLTRKYSLSKLEKDTTFEAEVRERWLSWYKKLAQLNGGEDWGEWHKQYDRIDEEWRNFKEILLWCQNNHRYEEVRDLWKFLNRFAYLYGYWVDRLKWLEWLIDESSQKGDLGFLAEAKSSYGWLVLLMEGDENLLKAEKQLQEAWDLRRYCASYIGNVIAVNLAVLYTRKKAFEKADEWFGTYNKLRKENGSQTNSKDAQRLEIRYLLYWGESYYRRENYDRAKKLYRQVVKKSDAIQWLRMKIKAYERLAFIAIKEANLELAEELLRTWYPVAELNKEYRRRAFYERDYAYLEFSKKNYGKAKEWAMKALKKFQDLKMLKRVETMNEFIMQCESQ
jgi:NB-ARC domain